jgi:hypothetical protein
MVPTTLCRTQIHVASGLVGRHDTHFDYGRVEQVPHVLWAAKPRLGERINCRPKSSSVPRLSLLALHHVIRHAPFADVHDDRYTFRQVLTLDGELCLKLAELLRRALPAMLARSAPISRLTQARFTMQSTVRARPDFALESESASIAWTPLSSLSLRPHGELSRTWMYIGLGAPWQRSPR